MSKYTYEGGGSVMPEKRAGKDSTCKIKREHVHQNKGIMFPVLLPESITSSVTPQRVLSRGSSALRLLTLRLFT